MAIVDKPRYNTQEENDLDSKINEVLKPILSEAISNGMSTTTMSNVAHCSVSALVAEFFIEEMCKNN